MFNLKSLFFKNHIKYIKKYTFNYIILYKNWVENNFDKKLSPSVDRINNNVDYKIENIQIITVLDNLKKGSR